MRLFSSGWLSRLTPLMVVASLFLFAAFLHPQQLAPGPPVTTGISTHSSSHTVHTYKGATQEQHPPSPLSHPKATPEEAQSTDKHPLKAGLLTMLVLGLFCGPLFLVFGDWWRCSRCGIALLTEASLPSLTPHFGQVASPPLFEVFRL